MGKTIEQLERMLMDGQTPVMLTEAYTLIEILRALKEIKEVKTRKKK